MKILTVPSTTNGIRHFWVESTTPVIDLTTASGFRFRCFRRRNGDHLGLLNIETVLYVGLGETPRDCFKNALIQYKEWRLQPLARIPTIVAEMQQAVADSEDLNYPKGKLYE